MVDVKLGWLTEMIEKADDDHDLDNEQLTTTVASRRMSNPNDLPSIRILR